MHMQSILCFLFLGYENLTSLYIFRTSTAQKIKFSTDNFFSKCGQIHRKLWIWLHLLKKSYWKSSVFVQCLLVSGSITRTLCHDFYILICIFAFHMLTDLARSRILTSLSPAPIRVKSSPRPNPSSPRSFQRLCCWVSLCFNL